jgi:extracellular matrix regulatory protein A
LLGLLFLATIEFKPPTFSLLITPGMDIRLINIGFGNIVSANRVIAIVSPESAPIKRIITDARDSKQLIDATYGRRTRAVIITDSGHVILSAIQPETVANRFMTSKDAHSED